MKMTGRSLYVTPALSFAVMVMYRTVLIKQKKAFSCCIICNNWRANHCKICNSSVIKKPEMKKAINLSVFPTG